MWRRRPSSTLALFAPYLMQWCDLLTLQSLQITNEIIECLTKFWFWAKIYHNLTLKGRLLCRHSSSRFNFNIFSMIDLVQNWRDNRELRDSQYQGSAAATQPFTILKISLKAKLTKIWQYLFSKKHLIFLLMPGRGWRAAVELCTLYSLDYK